MRVLVDGASFDSQILKGPLIGFPVSILISRYLLIILILHKLGNLFLILLCQFALSGTAEWVFTFCNTNSLGNSKVISVFATDLIEISQLSFCLAIVFFGCFIYILFLSWANKSASICTSYDKAATCRVSGTFIIEKSEGRVFAQQLLCTVTSLDVLDAFYMQTSRWCLDNILIVLMVVLVPGTYLRVKCWFLLILFVVIEIEALSGSHQARLYLLELFLVGLHCWS